MASYSHLFNKMGKITTPKKIMEGANISFQEFVSSYDVNRKLVFLDELNKACDELEKGHLEESIIVRQFLKDFVENG